MEYCKKPFNQNECNDNKCPVRYICDYYMRQKQITAASNTTTEVRVGVDDFEQADNKRYTIWSMLS